MIGLSAPELAPTALPTTFAVANTCSEGTSSLLLAGPVQQTVRGAGIAEFGGHLAVRRSVSHYTLYAWGNTLSPLPQWRAREMAGVAPRTEVYRVDDPLGYVVSENLKRRHLNESQRAIVAAKLAKIELGNNQYSMGGRPNLATQISLQKAADLLNVSRAQVASAKAVLHEDPKAAAKIESGESTVHREARRLARQKAVAKVAETPASHGGDEAGDEEGGRGST